MLVLRLRVSKEVVDWFSPVASEIAVVRVRSGIETLVLPAVVLALRPLAYFTQVMRASMLDVLAAGYITAARSRGLSVAGALVRHGHRHGIRNSHQLGTRDGHRHDYS